MRILITVVCLCAASMVSAGTITLRMSMLSGKEVVETAKVVEAHDLRQYEL